MRGSCRASSGGGPKRSISSAARASRSSGRSASNSRRYRLQANVEVRDVILWDQYGRADIDGRRPAAVDHLTLARLAQLGDRVLEHLLVQFDPDLADVARLLVAQQIAACRA